MREPLACRACVSAPLRLWLCRRIPAFWTQNLGKNRLISAKQFCNTFVEVWGSGVIGTLPITLQQQGFCSTCTTFVKNTTWMKKVWWDLQLSSTGRQLAVTGIRVFWSACQKLDKHWWCASAILCCCSSSSCPWCLGVWTAACSKTFGADYVCALSPGWLATLLALTSWREHRV